MRILIPLDGSIIAETALLHGRAFGKVFDAESVLLRVVAMDPVEPGTVPNLLDWQLRRRHAEAYLSEVRSRFGVIEHKVVTVVEEGRAAEEILRYASGSGIDLVVLTDSGAGASGPGWLGGTVGKIIAGLNASVLLVPQGHHQAAALDSSYRLVLAPVDGSTGSSWAARVAASVAMGSQATLLLVRVVQATELTGSGGYSRETRRLAERLTQAARLEAEHGLRILRSQLPPELKVEAQVVVAPSICRVIKQLAEARRADLLIISAHGFDHEMDWKYGPVTERLLMHATCPILVLQHDVAAVVADTGLPEESGRWRIPPTA